MNRIVLLFLSLCFPGLSHWLLGYRKKAAVFFLIIVSCFVIGLAFDFDYYFRYKMIPEQEFLLKETNRGLSQVNHSPRILILEAKKQGDEWIISGHARPRLTLQVFCRQTTKEVQTQADYMGFFTFPALKCSEDQVIRIEPANRFFTQPADSKISVSHYNEKDPSYEPRFLEVLWYKIYNFLFPLLTSPGFYWLGSFFQALVLKWWALVGSFFGSPAMPAPLKDAGFLFLVMSCLFNFLLLGDIWDLSSSKRKEGERVNG